MCGILDANAVSEVFGESRPGAGIKFLEWIDSGRGRLVTGGKAREELYRASERFRFWAKVAIQYGRLKEESDDRVNAQTAVVVDAGMHTSDDPHILALAIVTGVRLLYSNDRRLQRDFRDKSLIDRPRGHVYTTLVNREFTRTHERLLRRKDLCGEPQG